MRETLSNRNLIIIYDKKKTISSRAVKQTPPLIMNILGNNIVSHSSNSSDPSKAEIGIQWKQEVVIK